MDYKQQSGKRSPKAETRRIIQVDGREIQLTRSHLLDTLGGYLVVYRNQCRITMSAELSDAAFSEGVEELLHLFKQNTKQYGVYMWEATRHSQQPAL
jgi:hypothetical protein